MSNRYFTLAALMFSGVLSPAHAGHVFSFHYTFAAGPPSGFVEGIGTLTTTDLDPITNSYTILEVTGTRKAESGAVEAIIALTAPGGFFNNNLLYAADQRLDGNGFSFLVNSFGGGNDGIGNVNVYSTEDGYTEAGTTIGFGTFAISSSLVSPVPEPASGLFLAFGLACLLAGRRLIRCRTRRV